MILRLLIISVCITAASVVIGNTKGVCWTTPIGQSEESLIKKALFDYFKRTPRDREFIEALSDPDVVFAENDIDQFLLTFPNCCSFEEGRGVDLPQPTLFSRITGSNSGRPLRIQYTYEQGSDETVDRDFYIFLSNCGKFFDLT